MKYCEGCHGCLEPCGQASYVLKLIDGLIRELIREHQEAMDELAKDD